MNGILLIDKPAGPTSHDLVAMVRRSLGVRRVGHAGTLDPFATGLLVVLVGQATKLSAYLMDAEKEYEATLRWGATTDTMDGTGEVVHETDASLPDAARIAATMADFVGSFAQTPPMYSAKKVNGRPLYRHARKGETIPRTAQDVIIHRMELLGVDPETATFSFRVLCSKGTYVRVLGEVLAERLGGLGHLVALRRTRSGRFAVTDAYAPLSWREGVAAEELADRQLSLDAALVEMPAVEVSAAAAAGLAFGRCPGAADIVRADSVLAGDTVRVVGPDRHLLALARPEVESGAWPSEGAEKILSLVRVFPREQMA
ncbi:MAG: tRNA pseudouridine(55) synthase TruB [Candidatus Lernaella stagnicola]|nr:tRNA pseudouridine(55) synthase TruB [Candidatus Lernaella stagnicola]